MLWSPNLQLHYPLENSALDYSGNGRTATISGSGVYDTKPDGGRCLYFDRSGDYAKSPNITLSGTVVILSAWLKNLGWTSGYLTIFTYDTSGKYIWCFNPSWDSTLGVDISAGGGALLWNFFDGNWQHLVIAINYTAKEVSVFRNGSLLSTQAIGGSPVFPNDPALLAIGTTNTGDLFSGYMQNVQLWTLQAMPSNPHMLANVNRLMLGMNPIW